MKYTNPSYMQLKRGTFDGIERESERERGGGRKQGHKDGGKG